MSNLAITPQWHDEINQVETSEPITGGADGNANLATKQLAESLLWLKQQFETKKTETYKVGDIYMTTIAHADPAAVKAHHGYGTWVRYAEGRAPVGFSDNTGDIAEYKTMGNTFGDNTHQLKVDEMPSHYHTSTDHMAEGKNYDNSSMYYGNPGAGNIEGTFKTGSTGGNQPHNNIQPSIVTGYWLRTA
jgi:hypothetical protein